MKVRKLLAAGLVAGIATFGVSGIAAAQDGSGTSTPTTHPRRCVVTLFKLQAQKHELEGKIDVLQRERNAALQHHDFKLAARLEKDIVTLQVRKAVVEQKIDYVQRHCTS